MARKVVLAAVVASLVVAGVREAGADPVSFRINTEKVANPISRFVYGHFFEHIYNGGDNGLWGEMVWNRSFEYQTSTLGKWENKNGVVSQTAMGDGIKSVFGDVKWKDYEFTVDARKTSGQEGFLILVHATEEEWIWANIGGWGNSGAQLQHMGKPREIAIGRRVAGKVGQGQWYKVRVRCEGSRIQVFLDDQKLIDENVPPQVDHAGAVGVGTWQTTAEFKNAKVTGADGRVLYQGAPEIPAVKPGAGIHWKVMGDVHVTPINPFNDDFSVEIAGNQQEAGVSQEAICLREGEMYKGSLFVRGTSINGGKVRFVSDGKTVAEVGLPAPTKEWKEYPIQFTAKTDAPDATMQIVFGPGANVAIDQVSLMAESSIKNDGFRPDVYKAFADLKPTIIRWPGGCYLEQYHWKNGVGPQSQRKKNLTAMWDDYDPNALGTDEYMKLCEKTGATPLLVVNTGMHVTGTKNAQEWGPWIKEACDWVEYANGPTSTPMGKLRAANGHPAPYKVKYWEIDNELWRSLVTNPAVYAQAVPLFAAAMKRVDPSITIIAHGGNGTDVRYNRVLLNNAAPSFDYLSIHHYTSPNGYETGVLDQEKLYKEMIGYIKQSKHPQIKLDVSEWNLQTTDWRTGLYAGGLLNTFEKYGDMLEIGGPALLFRHVSAREWDNAFINFDHKACFVAPNYVVMKLWREHYLPDRVDADTSGVGRLNIVATRSKDGATLAVKMVNPTGQQAEVTGLLEDPKGRFAGATCAMELVAPGTLNSRNTMETPEVVKVVPGEVKLVLRELKFVMPPWSVGVVEVKGK